MNDFCCRNGMLREYFIPGVSQDEFRSRLKAVIDDKQSPPQDVSSTTQQSSEQSEETTSSPAPAPEPVAPASSTAAAAQSSPKPNQSNSGASQGEPSGNRTRPAYVGGPKKFPAHLPQNKKEHKPPKPPSTQGEQGAAKGKAPIRITKNEKPAVEPSPSRPTPKGPPTQYRLQVRLFDGSSVRSTFDPSHTIHRDVRPWLDSQLEENRPYNLKFILTPLPNRTLTITEEDQELRELITGSTATFVMVPIKTYNEAYSDSGSLPVRAASSVYGLVTSAIGGAIGYTGSFLGYVQNRASSSQPEPHSSEPQAPSDTTRRPRPWGAHLRTLGDQGDGQDSQLYNGNQVRFGAFAQSITLPLLAC